MMGYVRLGWCGLVPSRAIWLLMAFLLRFHTRVRPLNVTFVGSWAILQKIVLCVASVWSAGNPGISSGIVQCVCVGFKGLWIVLILFLWVMPRGPPPPSASPPGTWPPPVVLSGVPPIAPLANPPDGVASQPVLGSCEESSSVDVRDNQLDELASQSILADVSVDGPVSASVGPFGIKIGSSQPRAESQIPNLSAPVDTVTSDVSSDDDSLVSVSEGEIKSSSNESNVSEHSSVISISSNVIDNTNTTKENISESNVMDNTNTIKENISESNVMESTCTVNENISSTKNSNVNDNVSNSESVEIANSLTNSGSNLVSPGSSLNSVSFSGGAEAPLSSVGVLDSAVRVSNVPSGLRLSKGSSSGVSKPAAARPSGLRPGLRKVISDWSLVARRKR